MRKNREISQEKLDWLEKKLTKIAEQDEGENVSDVKLVQLLHLYCESDEDYSEVIDFVENTPNINRIEIIELLLDIGDKYS